MPIYSPTGGWVDLGYYTGTFTSSTSNSLVWPTTITNSSYAYTWNTTSLSYTVYDWGQGWVAEPERAEIRADIHQALDADLRAERRSAERISAHSRAEELLLSLLSPEQAESYSRSKSFIVQGSHGGRYRIAEGVSGNILLVNDEDESLARFCAHPTMRESWLPTPDVQVAQLLALITDEKQFIDTANIHQGRYPEHLRLVS